MDPLDLESYWRRLRPQKGVEKPKDPVGKGWNLRQAIVRAAAKVETELTGQFAGIDPQVISRVATTTLRCFLEAWYDELHGGDSVALIGVVLDGSDLTTDELKGFVQALPASLLQRIVDFPTPEASGIQALLAIEHQRRKKEAPEYTLSRDPVDGKLVVSFRPGGHLGAQIDFKLDETFEGAPHPGVITR